VKILKNGWLHYCDLPFFGLQKINFNAGHQKQGAERMDENRKTGKESEQQSEPSKPIRQRVRVWVKEVESGIEMPWSEYMEKYKPDAITINGQRFPRLKTGSPADQHEAPAVQSDAPRQVDEMENKPLTLGEELPGAIAESSVLDVDEPDIEIPELDE
jgi:hypothetical protein